ncbi:MAG: hypothetical protein ACFFCW_31305 [Candidatus Hodarchaeota archaeon]
MAKVVRPPGLRDYAAKEDARRKKSEIERILLQKKARKGSDPLSHRIAWRLTLRGNLRAAVTIITVLAVLILLLYLLDFSNAHQMEFY